MDSPKKTTGCVCEKPGFCERHGINKPPGWHGLCRSKEKYFRAWEEGRGPGQQMNGQSLPRAKPRKPRGGPGTELKRLLGWIGFRSVERCPCAGHMRLMDARGPQWCRENVGKIVGWLEAEARRRKRGWMFSRIVVRQVVIAAIKTAERRLAKAARNSPEIAVVITTAPREGPPLLMRCLASVAQAGLDIPLVCAEPETELSLPVLEAADIFEWPRRMGCWRAWVESVRKALADNPESEAILTLQDDVELSPGVAEWLKMTMWPSPRCGVLLIYTSSLYAHQPKGLAPLREHDMHWLIGACAMLFPRHVAQQIVAIANTDGWQGHSRRTIDDPTDKAAVDTFVGRAINSLGLEAWSVNPSLANHDAKHSTVGHGAARLNRTAANWPGRSVDASTAVPAPATRYAIPSGEPIPTPPSVPEILVGPTACSPHLAVIAHSLTPDLGGGALSLFGLFERALERGYRITVIYRDRCEGLPAGVDSQKARPEETAAALARLRPSVLLTATSFVTWPEGTAKLVPSVIWVQYWRWLVRATPEILRQLESLTIPDEHLDKKGITELQAAAAVVANSDFTAGVVERIVGRQCDAVVTPVLGDARVTGGKPVRDRRYVMCPSAQILKGTPRFFQLARDHPGVEFLLLAGDRFRSAGVCEEAETIPNMTVRREWVDDMREVYAQTRAVYIGTETCESYSRVAAEARLNGIPLLVLAAGNLPNMIKGGGGIAVPRGATDRQWNEALRRVLRMAPEPTDEFNQDDRDKMIDVFDDVRLLNDVVTPLPRAPGIREVTLQMQRVLGTRTVPWEALVPDYRDARLIVTAGGFRSDLLAAGVPMLVWWCSHFAQMDITRGEYRSLAKVVDALHKHPHLGLVFTSQADAAAWSRRLGDRAAWLPACLDVDVEPFPTTNDGVFIPGPYDPRKNVGTALAACATVGVEAHVTGLFRKHPELTAIAQAIGVHLVVHECNTTDDVRRAAGSCRAALALSLAETFGYGPAECVVAGTPTISWAGMPALRPVDGTPAEWLITDPTDAGEVSMRLEELLAAPDRWRQSQLQVVRAIAERNHKAARRTLLGILQNHRVRT